MISSPEGFILTDVYTTDPLMNGRSYICGSIPRGYTGELFCEACFDEKHEPRYATSSHDWGGDYHSLAECRRCGLVARDVWNTRAICKRSDKD